MRLSRLRKTSLQGSFEEAAAREISRRTVLARMVKGAAGSVALFTLGEFVTPARAYADSTTCCTPLGRCSVDTCPAPGKCPSTWWVCKSGQCTGCIYSSGSWVSGECSPCGPGPASYIMCTDCHKNGCAQLCTCVSSCTCSGCYTPAEASASMEAVLAGSQ
jgi:hypothetical protein